MCACVCVLQRWPSPRGVSARPRASRCASVVNGVRVPGLAQANVALERERAGDQALKSSCAAAYDAGLAWPEEGGGDAEELLRRIDKGIARTHAHAPTDRPRTPRPPARTHTHTE